MTDLQVRYQTLQHEKDKLAEEKRLHDAQIAMYGSQTSKYEAETAKVAHEMSQLDASAQKLLAEANLTEKDVKWYEVKSVGDLLEQLSRIQSNRASGIGNVLKGIGSLIPS